MSCSNVSICQPLADTVSDLTQDIMDLNEEYLNAVGEGDWPKAGIKLAEIHRKQTELHAAQQSLAQCGANNNLQPLDATFMTNYTAFTDLALAPGPFTPTSPINIGLHFDTLRTKVTITSFPTVTIPVTVTVLGFPITETYAVTLPSALGTFSCSSGDMAIPVEFDFKATLDESKVNMTLDTEPHALSGLTAIGSDMDSQGNITLAGIGTFSGGQLDTALISVTFMGTISPLP